MRPRVTLKLATSLDGKIAMASGESRWITGEASRLQGHRLRAGHEAIMVGVETVLADNPQLSARIPGEEPAQPVPVVLDSRLRTRPGSHMGQRALIYTVRPPCELGGATVVQLAPDADGRPPIATVLADLDRRGITSVLVEGGGRVAAGLIRGGFVDAIEWFRAPIILGDGARSGMGALEFTKLCDAPRFRRLAVEPLGSDLWERYEKV